MKTLLACLGVLCGWACIVTPACAGWDNVFQPTLFERWRRPVSTSQYYVPPVVVAQSSPVVVAHSAPCDPCQKCTTNYVQRSYYQPVQAFETRTVMEQVTTMRTSYYYEPVTTYRYSSYYDPCTCCYQQVAVPTITHELRAKQCPVQSWVSRCVQVPVTAYQKVDYWQPQTTCCTTTVGAPIFNDPCIRAPGSAPQMPLAPSLTPVPSEQPPSISGTKTPGTGFSKPTMWEQYYPPIERNAPEIRGSTSGSSFPAPGGQLGLPVPVQQSAPPAAGGPAAPQPPVKLNQIAVGPDSRVEGQVVRIDNSPKPNAKVLFVNASTLMRRTIHANTAGRFLVDLPAGSWHVYLYGADDLPFYHSRVDVNGSQIRAVSLVSRSNR
jgi:hypothetical protein